MDGKGKYDWGDLVVEIGSTKKYIVTQYVGNGEYYANREYGGHRHWACSLVRRKEASNWILIGKWDMDSDKEIEDELDA